MSHLRLTVTSLIVLLAAVFATGGDAQAVAQPEEYKFDLGAGVGMSGYLGDLNESFMFQHPGVTANLSLRYLANSRLAVRGVVGISTLKGSSADMENVIPGGEVIDFSSTFCDIAVRGEFNFFNYGIGETYKQLRRVTPYLSVGVGCGLASTGGNTSVAMTLPVGVGVKYKIKPRLNLALEFTMTKVFGDKVDSPLLDDPYMIKSSFIKNTDWTSGIVLSLSYEFGRRCVACNRQD